MSSRSQSFRACAACKLRKVKCDGKDICSQCAHTGLACISSDDSLQDPKESKPKGRRSRRGKVISSYRERTSNPSPGPNNLLPRPQASTQSTDRSFFKSLVADYMSSIYQLQPILSEAEIHQTIDEMDVREDALPFVHALAAYTLALRSIDSGASDWQLTIDALIDQSIRNQRLVMQGFRSSVYACITSLYLYNLFLSKGDSQASLFYMKNAATLVQMLGVEDSSTLASLTSEERAKRQRLHWVAYMDERVWAIMDEGSPILAQPSSLPLPEEDHSIPKWIYEGLYERARLFRVIDAEFLQIWLTRNHGAQVSAEWVKSKQEMLGQAASSRNTKLDGKRTIFSGEQQVDLLITKYWIQMLIWRIALCSNLLSLDSEEEGLSLLQPLRLCGELRLFFEFISPTDINFHGVMLIHMLFEVVDTIADVMDAVLKLDVQDTEDHSADFRFVMEQFCQLRALDETGKSKLVEKLTGMNMITTELGLSPYRSNSHGLSPYRTNSH